MCPLVVLPCKEMKEHIKRNIKLISDETGSHQLSCSMSILHVLNFECSIAAVAKHSHLML